MNSIYTYIYVYTENHGEFAQGICAEAKKKKKMEEAFYVQLSPLFQLESSPPPLPGGNHGDRVPSCFMIHSSPAIGRFPKLSAEILWLMARGWRRGFGVCSLDRVRLARSNSNCLFRSPLDKGGKKGEKKKRIFFVARLIRYNTFSLCE